ncbi:MAG TPA: hypothetical protein VGX03_34205 [Candidatus Binatia bacterium]|nr:hypothetical protein [Candidatus Binatia bacterium]
MRFLEKQCALSNLCYDVILVRQSKLKARTIYDRSTDCQATGDSWCKQPLKDIKRGSEWLAGRLRAGVEQLVPEEKFHSVRDAFAG